MSMAAPVSAAQAVGEFLQSPDDLLKLAAFRKKLEKEKASIDVRLKIGVKEQLDATRDGLRKLFGTRSNVQAVKDEMESVDRMCNDPKIVVSTFDQISRVRSRLTVSGGRFLPAHRCPWSTVILNKPRKWSTTSLR